MFDGNDDDDVALSFAFAEELAKLGAKKVEHLVDLDEAEIRAAAAAAQLPAVQLKRLVKLRAQVQSQALPCAPYEIVARNQQLHACFEQAPAGSTSAGSGGGSVSVSDQTKTFNSRPPQQILISVPDHVSITTTLIVCVVIAVY